MSSKLKIKRFRDRRPLGHRVIRERVKKYFPGQKVIVGPTSDGIKMSEVLEKFIEPYMDFVETEEAYRKLLTTALVAWNATLVPENERLAQLEELLATLSDEVRNDGRNVVKDLMVRKEKYFSHHQRMIIDFKVTDTGRGWNWSVMSMAVSK